MKKALKMIPLAFVLLFAFAGMASAHVVVFPKEVQQGTYEKFTVRVPSEKETATTMVKVVVPEGVDISRVKAIPGWSYTFEKDASGKVKSITWKAEDKGIASTEFGEFDMQGKVSDNADQLIWKAYQTYADNSEVKWIGPEDSDKPASITVVSKATGEEADHHGAHSTAAVQSEENEDDASSLPLYLSIGALVIAVLAFIVSLMKKK
ncbi:YcnI family protein [Falsibacillus pallidus]|uniref:Uncharacterized protein YcnI n=1 Tax=Falsibacillus pallidus TaxID=493781 RepID=A0A370G9P5_9BACI|nr:YcnI family protein [Falsibacillus pallidus]RDI39906.1 uncharacterized protein YcnI [Falsibacillus pallidus]